MEFTGVHHVGITVRSLDDSLEWFESALDLRPDFIAEGRAGDLSRHVGVPNAEIVIAFISVGNTRIELLQYRNARAESYVLSNADVGASHVCFEVDDIERAYEILRGRGVVFNAAPTRNQSGPMTGGWFAYFRTPDGLSMELLQSASTDDSAGEPDSAP